MEKGNNSIIYEAGYPVLSFDVFEGSLIAIIYQADGYSKLSIKNALDQKELYFYNLNVAHLNARVMFINSQYAVCFDGNMLLHIDFIQKIENTLSINVDDFSLLGSNMSVLLKTGSIILYDLNTGKYKPVYSIDNYKRNENNENRHVFCQTHNADLIIVASDRCIILLQSSAKNKLIDSYCYEDDVIKSIVVDKILKYAVCIVSNKNRLSVFAFKKEKLELVDFLDIQNCSCLFIMNNEYLVIGTYVGFVSVIELKSQKLIYSKQHHISCVRTIIGKKDFSLYSSGDDGIIIKSKLLV